jgi:heterodisulfide reductase subunit A
VATAHASLIRQRHPGTSVTIGYTDMRTPGKSHEEYYRQVQSQGVRYVRSRVGELATEPGEGLSIRFEDTVTGRKQWEKYDLVILSAGLEASSGTGDIAKVAGLQTHGAGFIKEYHPKLRPVDTQRAGIFVCGTAQGPKTIPESIAQAKAAASRAVSMLSAGYLLSPVHVALVDPAACIGCGLCAAVCPHSAVALTHHAPIRASVALDTCRGCGICVAECPASALSLGGFSDAELLAEARA